MIRRQISLHSFLFIEAVFIQSINSFIFFYVYANMHREIFKFYPITTATILLKSFVFVHSTFFFYFLSLDIISLHENRENVSTFQDVDAQISTWVASSQIVHRCLSLS